MAKRPAKPAATMLDPDVNARALDRLQDARLGKADWDRDMREALWFSAPHRCRDVSSRSLQARKIRTKDASELNTSFAMELAGDFATVMVNTFFPQGEQWAMRKASAMVKGAAGDVGAADIDKQAEDGDRNIFAAIGESNFYAEVGKGFTPDLAIGTVALWQEMKSGARPMKFMCVPIRELEIALAPDGSVGDRFLVRHTKMRHAEAILGERITMPRGMDERDGEDTCEIVRGFLQEYPDDGSTKWTYVAMIDEVLVETSEIIGDGSCPLIVARFNPSPDYAGAPGPLIQALPDLRVCDEMAMQRIRGVELTINPPIAVPDDSMGNFEEGIEPGCAYPIRPGDEKAIKNLYDPPPQEPAIYATNDLETRIKRLFFLDYPDQPGKTPPTATQWLDEMTMAQRRIGTPGLPFWWEFCAEVFKRAEFLLEAHGINKPIAVGGKATKGITRLFPYNPAQKAIEQQKVAQFSRFVQIAGQAFPEEFKITSDGTKTVDALAKIMGVDDIWKERDEAGKANAVKTIAQLQGGQAPGAPQVPDGSASPTPDTGAPITPQVQLKGPNV